MLRARIAAVAAGAASAHCDALWTGLGMLLPFIVVIAGLAVVLETARRLVGPSRFDRRARLVAETARRVGLRAPPGALALRWPLPSGFEVEAKAPQDLEITLPMPDQVPDGVGIDRPNLERGQMLEQVRLPDSDFRGFLLYGVEAEILGLLTRPVREVLQECAQGDLHVAIEHGQLRVRLSAPRTDLTTEAVERLDRVAQVIARLPHGTAARLSAQVRSDDVREVRQRALRALVDGYPDTPEAAEAIAHARTEALDDVLLRRLAGRTSVGALSLPRDDLTEGAIAIADEPGALSEAADQDDDGSNQ